MVSEKDLPNIPDCNLKKYFIRKFHKSPINHLGLLACLVKFEELVTDELQFVRDTFPEFTPHDEKHHLSHLFHIADDIIGESYKNFSFSELYLLIAGIYGHDWGMAISKESKKYILNQSLSESDFQGEKKDLQNERINFLKFVKNENMMFKVDNNYSDISDLLWQKFVRITHAERSCYRVYAFFSEIDATIAEAVSKICLGHSLDFQELEQPGKYPEKEPILNETVNLKAITLYLRIIDLMDIGKSRAPLTLLKFEMPLNTESKKHWDNNRAIDSIATSPFSNGRQIQVRGGTSDPETFAALEDLKNFYKLQIETTSKIFDKMRDPRHKFDIIYVDWSIKPNGFKGISIKFEFDREEMFKILSSEIYQRDPFVFLRELLQNSIDALRLKKEFYKKNKNSAFLGYIKVDIDYDTEGKITINWYDNGIGMDEYIVKNYLSVIGKSFYEKSNLEKLGIILDPISKFGIGILSCFYVANAVEIRTQKDLAINQDSIPLEIKIPDVTKQFRVVELPRNSIKQGTEVKIFTEINKIFKGKKIKESIDGKFTNYLREIAGFVDFSIIITENGKTTVIQHPDKKTEPIAKKYPKSLTEKISYDYPFSLIFLPQDVDSAKKIFFNKILNIRTDLHLKDFEGAISILCLPKNFEWITSSLTLRRSSLELGGISIFDPKSSGSKKDIRWYDHRYEYFDIIESESKSSLRHVNYAIFTNGILLRDEKSPFMLIDDYHNQRLPLCFLNVNILKRGSKEINLARTNLLEDEARWSTQLTNALINFFLTTEIPPLLEKNMADRFHEIGRLLLTYPIDTQEVALKIPRSQIPIVMLEKNGKLKFSDIRNITTDAIYSIPEKLIEEIIDLISAKIVYKKKYTGILNEWCGISCYGTELTSYEPFTIPSINISFDFSGLILKKDYECSELIFVYPPKDQDPPLIQKIFRKIKNKREETTIESILETASLNPQLLTPHEISLINESKKREYLLRIPEVYNFQGSLSDYFAFGWEALNLKHPITQKIIQIFVKSRLNLLTESDSIIFGKINDQIAALRDISYRSNIRDEDARKILNRILELSAQLKIISDKDLKKLSSIKKIFIPYSFATIYYRSNESPKYKINPLFGKII
jgi:hypothetical protein